MTDPERKPRKKSTGARSAGTKRAHASPVRDGGTELRVTNSGLEVWLYDDASIETIRSAGTPDAGFGGMPAGFEDLARQGLVVGYSLQQDDDLHVAVHVGKPFTKKELSVARWLEPQQAFLRLPSGRLCVESNDASRIGPEDPGATGAVVEVPAGDYRLTLHRIDHEALDREGLTWDGPEEVILLTPGGGPEDAANDLLPFQARRDTSWVGKYAIRGNTAEALAWFSDYWDTCVVNLDPAAAATLSLVPGSYLRIEVPTAGLTLISAFANSWDEARRFAPPADVALDEYGYAAFCPMSDWDGAVALFCRRDTTKKRVEDEHQNIWLPAVVEVMDARADAQPAAGPVLTRSQLRDKNYFDSGFLALILSDVLPEVGDLDELELPDALGRIDRALSKLDMIWQGDASWSDRQGATSRELTARLYGGLRNCFAAIVAGEGRFDLVFISEMDDATWIVTGLADELERYVVSTGPDGLPVPHARVQIGNMDEPLADIFAAHRAALRGAKAKAVPAPDNFKETVAAMERFLAVVAE